MSEWDAAPQALRGLFALASFIVGALILSAAALIGCTHGRTPAYNGLTLIPAERSAAQSAEPTVPLRIIADLVDPRALAYDAERDELYVGVMIGESFSRDSVAFVMLLSGEGALLDARFVEFEDEGSPLREIRALAASGNRLYLLQSKRLLIYNRASAELLKAIPINGARALHAMALGPDDEVYLADRGLTLGARGFMPEESDAIYRVDTRGSVTRLAHGPELGRPGGLDFVDGSLWIASFGSGELYRLSEEGELVERRSLSAGSLDGVVALSSDRIAIASWEAAGILIGEPRGRIAVEIHGVGGPAAIAFDTRRDRLFVALPLMNELRIFELGTLRSED